MTAGTGGGSGVRRDGLFGEIDLTADTSTRPFISHARTSDIVGGNYTTDYSEKNGLRPYSCSNGSDNCGDQCTQVGNRNHESREMAIEPQVFIEKSHTKRDSDSKLMESSYR